MTVLEFAKLLGVEKDTAYALLRFLTATGLAVIKGGRRPPSGKGKAENVYAFREGTAERLRAVAGIIQEHE